MPVVNNKSKEIRPVIAIPASIIAFGVTYASLNNVVVGLKTGKIAWSVKGMSGVAVEANDPGAYWFHVVEYSVLGLAFACITIWMLRHAWRGLRK
jgi:hypothetical protein